MNAAFENNAIKGPGHGFIHFGRLETLPNTPTFSLQRAGDHLFLGTAGWQEAEEQLVPADVSKSDAADALRLSVGSVVVDQLDPLETYRVTLHGGSAPVRATLRVEHVVLSPLAGSGNLHEAKAVRPAAPVAPVQPVVPVAELKPDPLPMPEPTSAPTGNKWILPVVLAALLIGGGAAGWWYWQGMQAEKATAEKTPPEKNEADSPAAEKTEIDTLAAEKAAAEKAAAEKTEADTLAAKKVAAERAATQKAEAEKPVLSAKQQAREFLRGQGTTAEAVKLANTLPTVTPEDQDAVFLLMEMASQGGNPEAMLTLARYYSPADTAPAGSIIKDPEQAALWLKKAAAVPGTAEKAKAAMAALKGWLEKSDDPAVKSLIKTLE